MDSSKKSKVILVLVLVTFILPVVIAKLVLNFEWYQGGKTNKGQLISTNESYLSFEQENPYPKQWQMLYLVPNVCHQACQYKLYLLKQTHTALGKERDRVIPLIAVSSTSDTSVLTDISLPYFQINPQMANSLSDHVVIIDPLGHFVMRYQNLGHQQAQMSQGKDLLTDLRKLLKLSRIG